MKSKLSHTKYQQCKWTTFQLVSDSDTFRGVFCFSLVKVRSTAVSSASENRLNPAQHIQRLEPTWPRQEHIVSHAWRKSSYPRDLPQLDVTQSVKSTWSISPSRTARILLMLHGLVLVAIIGLIILASLVSKQSSFSPGETSTTIELQAIRPIRDQYTWETIHRQYSPNCVQTHETFMHGLWPSSNHANKGRQMLETTA